MQDSVYDAFAEKLAAAARGLKVGPGTEAGVTVGPLINADAVKKVSEHVADAVKRARLWSSAASRMCSVAPSSSRRS